MLAREIRGDGGQVAPRGVDGNAGLESSHGAQELATPHADGVAHRSSEVECEVEVDVRQRSDEVARQHPDDGARDAVDADSAADDARIAAEQALPRAVRDDDVEGSIGDSVLLPEHTAERSWHA